MARKIEHSEAQIKEMVLQAAQTLVTEEGVAALKVREIAMEIGYTVSCIYKVFDNMADLTLQLKARTLDDLLIQLAQISKVQPAEQQLISLVQSYLNFAKNNFNRWTMLFEQLNNEPLPDWYHEKQIAVFAYSETIFQHLAPQHSLAQQQQAARVFWLSLQGFSHLSLSKTDDKARLADIEHDMLSLTQRFVAGWLAE